jgi:hypothetical protein
VDHLTSISHLYFNYCDADLALFDLDSSQITLLLSLCQLTQAHISTAAYFSTTHQPKFRRKKRNTKSSFFDDFRDDGKGTVTKISGEKKGTLYLGYLGGI